MYDLVKIKDVTAKYGLSARTLRYYEDMGLIASTRTDDYAYRLYDPANIKRLEQILILRKLHISIKDIQRVFAASGSEAVLEVLGKKANDIDEEISLLHELKEIVLEFISQIESADFGKESDVKLLYEKARDLKTQLASPSYGGNPSIAHRLLDVTERLDRKVPDIMIVRVPKFRAVTSGPMTFEGLFEAFESWQEAHKHLFTPVMFDAPDFLCGKDGVFEWFWAVKEGVTEADTFPYKITEHPGGLYAAAVSLDGDGESQDRVRAKTAKWLEGTNFVFDDSRLWMGHMVFVDDEIRAGLGYHQMNLYTPIKLAVEQ